MCVRLFFMKHLSTKKLILNMLFWTILYTIIKNTQCYPLYRQER